MATVVTGPWRWLAAKRQSDHLVESNQTTATAGCRDVVPPGCNRPLWSFDNVAGVLRGPRFASGAPKIGFSDPARAAAFTGPGVRQSDFGL